MNTYRVDRNDCPKTPCGMNSIVYIGDSLGIAKRTFNITRPNIDTWGKEDETYGVVLSRWNGNDYAVIDYKPGERG